MKTPLIAVLGAALTLAGCASRIDPKDLNPNNLSAVCQALVGPIKYNSQNVKSKRHAGPELAPDLKRRNQIGQALHCPQYR